ncbi:MAG: site-specific DNA-methyltransferase [Tannerellaceae bacterium]|jgi:DNA modification methylase|nr:site-specific DNA-methyltransferase [Tannerellaceae bacterium]
MVEVDNIYVGDCSVELKSLPDNSVDRCVTSPPYYGLRDYGTATWVGGSPNCQHSVREEVGFENCKQSTNRGNSKNLQKGICPKCGAIREDNQIGLEDTPEAYIQRLVEVFTEVYRVLKPEGTLWLNIGDSYWGGKGYSGSSAGIYQYERRKEGKSITRECSNFGGKGTIRPTDRKHEYIKPKDLIGIPWMLAFALRNAGWYLRQDIIWNKPNPMPESVKDRCTKSHEYIFLLAKSSHYYFDHEAILEPASYDGRKDTIMKGSNKYLKESTGLNQQIFAARGHERWPNKINGSDMQTYPARNKRDVWTVQTKPYKDAHFATYPPNLIVDCINAGCPENGIVLDPFMGSGTTAIVARKLNRHYIGFELNPDYIEIADKRIRELGFFK